MAAAAAASRGARVAKLSRGGSGSWGPTNSNGFDIPAPPTAARTVSDEDKQCQDEHKATIREEQAAMEQSKLSMRLSFTKPRLSLPRINFGLQNTFEPKDLDFVQLARLKFGESATWHQLPIADQVELIREALVMKNLTINPNSDYMKCWDMVVVSCLIFTAFATPVEIAFLKPEYDFLYYLNRLVDLAFIKDMALQFFLQVKRHTKQGTVWLKDRRQIAKVYFKTWFFPDLISVLPYDDFTNLVVANDDSGSSDLSAKIKIVRLLRVLRLFKLLRILKASRVLMRWETRISLRYVTIYLIRFTVLIIVSCHWMACVWGFFGMLEGSNLECRETLDSADSRLEEYPGRKYFFKGDNIDEKYNPKLWDGQSWVVAFASGRAAGTTTNPCNAGTIYIASIYWAVMTMTSIGYGDILPSTLTEFVVCSVCMMVSSILWAYIISVACGVMMTMDPEQTEFEQRMDAFNALAEDQNLPQHIRYRGREYIREERYHERYMRNLQAMQFCGTDLQGCVARLMAHNYLDNIWFLRNASDELRADIANKMVPHFHEKRELIEYFGDLCIVERGAVGRGGRVLVPWSYWGDDMLLRNELLRFKKPCTTLTFTEIVTLSRHDMSVVLVAYPEEVRWFRRCAACVAMVRMACIYRQEQTGTRERLPHFAWIEFMFERARLAAAEEKEYLDKQKAKEAEAQKQWLLTQSKEVEALLAEEMSAVPPLGEAPMTVEARIELMQAQLDRLEQHVAMGLRPKKKPTQPESRLPQLPPLPPLPSLPERKLSL